MARNEEPDEGTDIQVVPPEAEQPVEVTPVSPPARRAPSGPTAIILKVRTRYKHLNRKDKTAVLLAVLAVVMVIVLLSIWTTGGGIGGPDLGPEIRPPSDWNMEALERIEVTGEGENTNLEGQETPYLVPSDEVPDVLRPAPGEILFLTDLSLHVEWTDESTPPTNVPAIGYENQPDGFMLVIRIHDDLGEWSTNVVFNPQGGTGSIDLALGPADLGGPIVVANKEKADYLPQGYVETIRVDFIVVTEECGDWTPSDPFRPTVGDAGNHFICDWSLVYYKADSTREP